MIFLALFTCHTPSIKAITYSDDYNHNFILHLDKKLEENNNPANVWDCSNFLSNLDEMFNETLTDNINRLIKDFYFDIDNELNPEVALINYVGSIEYYMSNERYSNNRLVSDLGEKLQRFINKVSNYLDKEYFINKILKDPTNKISSNHLVSQFVNQVRDTRDYLLHGVKENSKYLLKGDQIPVAVNHLKQIIYIFILQYIGLNNEDIKRYSQRNCTYGLKFFEIF